MLQNKLKGMTWTVADSSSSSCNERWMMRESCKVKKHIKCLELCECRWHHWLERHLVSKQMSVSCSQHACLDKLAL